MIHEAYLDGVKLDSTMSPVAYNPSTRTFSVYSDQVSDVGQKSIQIKGYLELMPEAFEVTVFRLSIVSVCDEPSLASLAPSTAPEPDTYSYGGFKNPASFELEPFVASPDLCKVTYSCTMVDSEANLCKDGSFNKATGDWTFDKTDPVKYPPGVYTFKITGSLGSMGVNVAEVTFEILFDDPCPDATLRQIREPFQD